MKKLKYLFFRIKHFILTCFFNLLKYFYPIKKNRIVLNNFYGLGFNDNPKYIALELLKNEKYELFWIVNDMNEYVPEGITKVKIGSFKEMVALMTCGMRISNIRNYHPIKLKKSQLYMQTWHGSLPFKLIEKEAIDKLSKGYVKMAKYDGRICNAIVSPSQSFTNQFKESFWLNNNCEILEYGLPRNDYLMQNSNNIVLMEKLKNKYNLPLDAKIILYAPTFRDDDRIEAYDLDFEKILQVFNKKYNKQCLILLRLHPNAQHCAKNLKYNKYVINASNITDFQELVLICDCLITDYSNVLFDFALLNKPFYLYTRDEKEYVKLRGLSENYYKLPFPKNRTLKELLNTISTTNEEELIKHIEKYKYSNKFYDDGNASFNIVQWINKKLKYK